MKGQWITVEQACEILGCNQSTLRRYIKQGRIEKWQAIRSRGQKRGSKPWVKAADVRGFLPPTVGRPRKGVAA